jgi:hypothetical protein
MHQKLTYRLRPFITASLAGVISLGMLVFAGRMAVADAPAQDVVQISDTPLGIMADQNKPNVMLLLDTSDSMKWTHMPDDWEQDGTTYFPVGYKSALCNTLYYNPQTTYVLPKRPDGRDMDAPAFENAWKDGYDQSLGTVDLSKNFQAYDNDTRRRALYEDPAQPAYFFEWIYGSGGWPQFEEPSKITVFATRSTGGSSWDSARVDDGTLRVNVRSNIQSWGRGPDGYWTRRAIPAAQRQNFANWYSYYRTRINMAKSSVSLAFSTLNDNFRIGFLTVANPGAGPHSKFLPVADFNTEGKQQWLEAIQTVKTGGTSPAREALARVGRYYAGQSDSINASMTPFVDPVVSACQRHYAIVTTDGYWNVGQESAGPVKIDGKTLVGQQDGPPESLTDADGLRPRPIFDGSVKRHQRRTRCQRQLSGGAVQTGLEGDDARRRHQDRDHLQKDRQERRSQESVEHCHSSMDEEKHEDAARALRKNRRHRPGIAQARPLLLVFAKDRQGHPQALQTIDYLGLCHQDAIPLEVDNHLEYGNTDALGFGPGHTDPAKALFLLVQEPCRGRAGPQDHGQSGMRSISRRLQAGGQRPVERGAVLLCRYGRILQGRVRDRERTRQRKGLLRQKWPVCGGTGAHPM